ncbi:hypothetical protein OPQ81_007249 [Rhizoctonia solani]|nr:hypothetical protein OPQ81_007249 [Rhizoctonia solani]
MDVKLPTLTITPPLRGGYNKPGLIPRLLFIRTVCFTGTQMPPKRAAASKPNTLKREANSPVLRRSARKRVRVEPATVKDEDSELTELEDEDGDDFKPEEKPSTSELGLSKFAYSGSSSRPKRTPAKVQVKLEDMDDIKLEHKGVTLFHQERARFSHQGLVLSDKEETS